MDDDSIGGLSADVPLGPAADETMLSGTPAFEALFAALEQAVPPGDQTLLGLLAGSSLASFG